MFLQEKVNDINRRLKALENVSNVLIWGAGVHTCKLFEKTDIFSYDIKNIVDIDDKKQKDKYFGFTVSNPKKIVWSSVGAVVISVPMKEGQIIKMLRNELGYTGNIITLYMNNENTPFYQLYDKNIPSVRYMGDYDNWNNAYNECDGYEDENIINTVTSAIQKVLNGDAVWERDGFLFHEEKYIYHICAVILKCALQKQNEGVRILDIGGSLGSTYFQNRKYLTDVKKLEYVVAEQEHFADYGYKNLQDTVLKFIKSTDNWVDFGKFDIVLMSASLQYISDYKQIIAKIMEIRPHYIILDRIMVSDRMRICRETVPENIYKGSYPIRIFSENEISHFFGTDYIMVEKDISSVPEWAYFVDGKAESMYYVFRDALG